jgi:EAL domain-containing protein (putative c-di-GMP-specific phosphodiesterase class I)
VDAAGHITSAESLVRWQHPSRGLVFPGEFIALAEHTGLILPMGQWILESACQQIAQWAQHPGLQHLTVSVNVSAMQLMQADFVAQVVRTLEHTGANPHRLKLELTESLLVSDVTKTIDKMLALKARGVGFSLDDFGTGYSSLAFLKLLPLDQLKIDQSFVRDILVDSNDAAIARMVIALGASLNLMVIAEGVETTEQRAYLAQQGCFAYQGYLFGRPMTVDAFEALVCAAQLQGADSG